MLAEVGEHNSVGKVQDSLVWLIKICYIKWRDKLCGLLVFNSQITNKQTLKQRKNANMLKKADELFKQKCLQQVIMSSKQTSVEKTQTLNLLDPHANLIANLTSYNRE